MQSLKCLPAATKLVGPPIEFRVSVLSSARYQGNRLRLTGCTTLEELVNAQMGRIIGEAIFHRALPLIRVNRASIGVHALCRVSISRCAQSRAPSASDAELGNDLIEFR
jgi:hypothetical protein